MNMRWVLFIVLWVAFFPLAWTMDGDAFGLGIVWGWWMCRITYHPEIMRGMLPPSA